MNITISKINESFIHIDCEDDIAEQLNDQYTFWTEGYRYMPSFKRGWFDGKIRLFNKNSRRILAGLRKDVEEFAQKNRYKVTHGSKFGCNEFSVIEAAEFIKTLNLPFTPHDHQVKTFIKAVREKRLLIESPTNSGKSLLIYLIMEYFKEKKFLLIVPDKALVLQMKADILSYGGDEREIHTIHAGQNKYLERRVTISTWQSLMRIKEKEYFEKYDALIGDEAHTQQAKEVSRVISLCTNAEYRYGTTGSVNNEKLKKATLTGLFGPFYKATTNKELIDAGISADLFVKGLLLKYSDEDRKLVSQMEWQEELDWIVTNKKRNNFIKNLALSLKGNTIIMVRFKEKHGEPLFKLIQDSAKGRNVYYISGDDDAKDRHELKAIIEKEEDAIIIASEGVFSRGISIKALHNLIKGSPSKSDEMTLQSLGRMLRVSDTKSKATLFDIGDDLSYLGYTNITLRHYFKRMKLYKKEQFRMRIYDIDVS